MRIRFGIPLSAHSVAEAIGAAFRGVGNPLFYSLSTDTRDTMPGDIFIALDGDRSSGEFYLEEAAKKGAYIISSSNSVLADFKVDNTRKALLDLAEYYKSKLGKLLYTIAITGSIGKTTTKELSYRICASKYKVHRTTGNYNNDIGVPLTILSAPRDTEILLIECGMNHKGELSRLSRCLHPDIAIITNIGTAHIGNLGSREAIAAAKKEIGVGMSNGIVLCDGKEPLLYDTYGYRGVGVNPEIPFDFTLYSKGYSDGQIEFDFISQKAKIYGGVFPHNAPNLLEALSMAISLGVLLGIDSEKIKKAVKEIPSSAFRYRIVDILDFKVLDDAYNASLESIMGALVLLKTVPATAHSALLGDILELGHLSREIHHKIGVIAAQSGITHLFLYGKNARHIAEGASEMDFPLGRIFINEDLSNPKLTASQIVKNHTAGEAILFKASHAINLGKILDIIAEDYKDD